MLKKKTLLCARLSVWMRVRLHFLLLAIQCQGGARQYHQRTTFQCILHTYFVCTLVPTLDTLTTSSVHSPHIHLCYTSCLIDFELDVRGQMLTHAVWSFCATHQRCPGKQAEQEAKKKNLLSFCQGYYKRTPAYMPIRRRERLGCFAVPMVHSTYLLDLQKEASRQLAFYPPHPEYSWALDDVIIFAYSARMAGEKGRRPAGGEGAERWKVCLANPERLRPSVPQACRCTCATRRLMGIFPCRCSPTPTCRTRPRASCIRSSRSWVS